jgi:hypothetical protein
MFEKAATLLADITNLDDWIALLKENILINCDQN